MLLDPASTVKPLPKRHLDLLVCLGLFVLAAVFLAPSYHAAQSINDSPFDISREFDLLYRHGDFKSANYLVSDQVQAIVPNYNFTVRTIKTLHTLPLWNPYIMTGLPFMADSQVAMFEWSRLVSYTLNLSGAQFLFTTKLLTLTLAGSSLYLFLLALKQHRVAAVSVAALFMFSGPFLVWLGYPLTMTFAWTPFLLLAVEKSRTSSRAWLLALAIGTMSMWLAGYPQLAFVGALLVSGYVVIRTLTATDDKRVASITRIIAAIVLGTGLAAFQLIPSWLVIKDSQSFISGRGGRATLTITEALREDLHLRSSLERTKEIFKEEWPMIVRPDARGLVPNRTYRAPSDNLYKNFSESTWFMGIGILLLALLATVFLSKRQPMIGFWALAVLSSAGVSLNLPFVRLLGLLPLINKISSSRVRLVTVLSLVILAVYALDHIFKRSKSAGLVTTAIVVLTISQLWQVYQPFVAPSTITDGKIALESKIVTYIKTVPLAERRVLGVGIPLAGFQTPLMPNSAMEAEVLDLRGVNPLLPVSYARSIEGELSRRGSMVIADSAPDTSYLDRLSVKFLICPTNACSQELKDKQNWKIIVTDNKLNLLERTNPTPRASLKLNDDHIVPAEIITYEPNIVVIKANTPKDAVLVLSDRFAEGWTATIDGQQSDRPTFTDDDLRTLNVPSGEHTVIWRYTPPGLKLGLTMSLVSLILLIACCISLIKQRSDTSDQM